MRMTDILYHLLYSISFMVTISYEYLLQNFKEVLAFDIHLKIDSKTFSWIELKYFSLTLTLNSSLCYKFF